MKVLVLSPASKGIKNVVRDLVYGCWCGGRRIGGMQMPPLNLLYTSTVLAENGHDVKFVDVGLDPEAYEDVKKRMNEFGVVIVLSSTNSFKTDVSFLEELKRLNGDIKTIIFGSHPTFMPEYCLKESCIDIIVRREPEFIIRDVVNALEKGDPWRDIKGTGYRLDGKTVLKEEYPFIADLDELPVPDRNLLPKNIDYFNPVIKRAPYTTIQTSRGCPARCNFCTVPSFYGKKVRCRSVDKIVTEIKMLRASGYKELFFRDETFTVYKERNREICQRLIDEKVDVTWICNARANMIEKEDIALMKRAGCHMIKFGVESGNQEILDNIQKGITLENTRDVFKMCHRAGMDTHAHVMLGCPGETTGTIEKTIRFVKEIDPLTVSFGIHTPYPGTDLFDRVVAGHPDIKDGAEAGMDKLHIKGFFNESFTDLKKEDLEKCVAKAYRAFYFRPSYIFKRLLSINSLNELARWTVAGSNIFSFGITKKQA